MAFLQEATVGFVPVLRSGMLHDPPWTRAIDKMSNRID